MVNYFEKRQQSQLGSPSPILIKPSTHRDHYVFRNLVEADFNKYFDNLTASSTWFLLRLTLDIIEVTWNS
eukprot:m.50394 g.50394  ORF g.50394 m.50394 type:complete len:70 (+) comp13415_c0_seq7:670-879(+)